MDLPNGWQETKIENIALVNSGQGAPQGDKWYNGDDQVFIKAGDLNNLTESKYVGDYCQNISDAAIKEYNLKRYPINSIVFPKSGMSVKTDNIALLKYDSYVVNHLAIIRITKRELCFTKYLYYLLKRVRISNLSLNEAYPSIRLEDIKKFTIHLPPIETQKEIAAILEKAEKLKEMRKEADMLTGEYLNSVFLEMFGDVSKFEWKRLQDVASKRKRSLSSGPFGSSLTSKHYTDKGVVVLRGLNISKGILNLDNQKFVSEEKAKSLVRSEIRPGDVVIVAVGSSGRALKIPEILPRAIMSQNFNKITPDLRQVNPTYLEYCINSNFVQNQFSREITDTVRTFLSLTKLKAVKVPVPPIQLQNKFAEQVKHVEQMREYQKQSAQQIDNLFNVLMQKAFRGELA